jgi:hypothetical protein
VTSGRPWSWGATPAEVERRYPADDLAAGRAMTRAVDVAARPEVLWRWLCQLAVAPYSHDWVDNLGRRSPRTLTPGADRLEVGQPMVTVFRLTSYVEGHSWSGVAGGRLLGTTSVTYAAEPVAGAEDRSRLVCRMVSTWPRPLVDALAWGDLVMMRTQLHTLRDLAEGTGPGSSGSSA